MPKEQKFQIVAKESLRLDKLISSEIDSLSRSRIETLINEGFVKVNKLVIKKKNFKVQKNDLINIRFESEEKIYNPSIKVQDINIVYEDDYLLAIEKPCGLLVHCGAGKREDTVVDWFCLKYPDESKKFLDKERPGIIHRLDKDTSGLLLLAKDEETLKLMQTIFQEREIEKYYFALVKGSMQRKYGKIEKPLIRHHKYKNKYKIAISPEDIQNARYALSEYFLIESQDNKSLLKVRIHTGRTHQIRIHLLSIKHPVLGDSLYGDTHKLLPRLALHSSELKFIHPVLNKIISIRSDIPDDFKIVRKSEVL